MKKTYILAEIAQGFEGDISLVKKYIRLAKKCGADGIKFQIFKASELCIEDYPYYSLFKSLEIDPALWTLAIDEAVQLGLDFWSDIYGTETLEWITKSKVKGIKIHSTDSKNVSLLNHLKNKGYTILLSTGGSTLEEVKGAVEKLGENQLILMSGFQGEPNLYNDIELEKIKLLKDTYNMPVGYADHIDANDELAVTLPAIAVLKGATLIEKHLTIERNHLQLEDYVSALNPGEFEKMVDLIRKTEQFNFNEGYTLSEREETYRKKTKKVVLAARDINQSEVIQVSDLTMLRTGKSYDEIIDLEDIVGKTAAQEIKKHDVIKRTQLI